MVIHGTCQCRGAGVARALILASLLSASIFAQITQTVVVGSTAGTGCQGTSNPPTLTGSVLASGEIDYTWDPATSLLTLVARNTSPIVPGEHTALITRIYVNVPAAATGGILVSQTQGSGTNAPTFNLHPGPIKANCMGDFGAGLLIAGGIAGGMANPAATMLPGPPGSQVMGPVTFVLGIATPNPAALTTQDFSQALSTGGNGVAAAMKFQGAGIGGEESGALGSAAGGGCPAPASAVNLGSGCFHTLDPVLTIDPPVMGSLARLRVDSDFPGAGGFVFFSVGHPAPTPYQGCLIFVDIANNYANFFVMFTYGADVNGDFEAWLTIPNHPAWLGLQFTLQAHMAVPNGPIGPWYPDWSSNGILVTFGCL